MSSHLNQHHSLLKAMNPSSTLPASAWDAPTPSSEKLQGVPREAPHHPVSHRMTEASPSLFAVSERFGASLTLSSVLGFCAAPLIAHGAAIESRVAVSCGVAFLVVAGIVQWRERKAAIEGLTARGVSLGLSADTARKEAHAILRKWLS